MSSTADPTLDALRLWFRLEPDGARIRLTGLIELYEHSAALYAELLADFNPAPGTGVPEFDAPRRVSEFDEFSAFKTLSDEQERFARLAQEARAFRDELPPT
jgi:hypothetical protein